MSNEPKHTPKDLKPKSETPTENETNEAAANEAMHTGDYSQVKK